MKNRDYLFWAAHSICGQMWKELANDFDGLSDRQYEAIRQRIIDGGTIVFGISLSPEPTGMVIINAKEPGEAAYSLTFPIERDFQGNTLHIAVQAKTLAEMKLAALLQKIQAAAPGQAIDVSKVIATEEEIVRDASGEIVKIIRKPHLVD
jgi:hypothetical protein